MACAQSAWPSLLPAVARSALPKLASKPPAMMPREPWMMVAYWRSSRPRDQRRLPAPFQSGRKTMGTSPACHRACPPTSHPARALQRPRSSRRLRRRGSASYRASAHPSTDEVQPPRDRYQLEAPSRPPAVCRRQQCPLVPTMELPRLLPHLGFFSLSPTRSYQISYCFLLELNNSRTYSNLRSA